MCTTFFMRSFHLTNLFFYDMSFRHSVCVNKLHVSKKIHSVFESNNFFIRLRGEMHIEKIKTIDRLHIVFLFYLVYNIFIQTRERSKCPLMREQFHL